MTDPSALDTPAKPKRTPINTRVQQVSRIGPHTVRMVLTGGGLREFPVGAFTDHYVKLLFSPVTRTFTVREYDGEKNALTIDFVVHGDSGIAGPWAAQARPGDEIALLGPGGGYAPSIDADWYLLAGDASALPAIAVALQRIPAGRTAHVFLEVDGAGEEQPLPSEADAHIHWVPRTATALLDAVRALEFPPGVLDAFVHGEAGAVRSLRRHLLAERGVAREALSASGYWKRGRTDEGWRADKPEWKRQAALEERSAGH